MPDVESPVEERDIGGLGVSLMRATMDDVHYTREGTKNKLTLKKAFQNAS